MNSEKKICVHLWLPERLLNLLDEDRRKRGETRTELIKHWLWGKVLPSNKQVVIKSTGE